MFQDHCNENIWNEKSARVQLNHAAHALTTIPDAGTPALDSVTSRMDDEWLLQSFVVSDPDPWNMMGSILPPGLPSFPCVLSQCSELLHSNRPEEQKSPSQNHTSAEESERRRARRERNRIAAARCRDRRRMLTASLQQETEHLEQVKTQLEEEIAGLIREKERLELVLEAHKPVCKMDE